MTHWKHYLAMLGLIGLVLAAPSAAMAQSDSGAKCVLEHVDERGDIARTSTEPDGALYGPFSCAGGQWQLSWAPYGPDDMITADAVQVDPAGNVSAREFALPAKVEDPTMAQLAGIAQAFSGRKDAIVERAVVAVDDGKERTPAEIKALLAGKDTTGVRVLATINKPNAAASTKDLINQTGTSNPTVIYFSVGSVVGWLVDKVKAIGQAIEDGAHWVQQHCTFMPPPEFGFVCNWG